MQKANSILELKWAGIKNIIIYIYQSVSNNNLKANLCKKNVLFLFLLQNQKLNFKSKIKISIDLICNKISDSIGTFRTIYIVLFS